MMQSPQDYPITQAVTAESSDSAFVQTALSPLNVPELLCMIIGNLAPEDHPSAARVCRKWSDPALDQIWHSIDSLAPLLRLVGPMIWGPKDEWEFTGDIHGADWSRYAFYAHRIQIITLSASYYYSRTSNQAFQAFVDHIPSHLSLPRPSSINAFMLSPAQVIPLISLSLRKLNVGEVVSPNSGYVYDCTVAMQAVVSAAAMLDEPCLESLEVVSSYSNATLLEALHMCLARHINNISTLGAGVPFGSQTWDSIFGLPALQTLDMAPRVTIAPVEIVSIIRTLVAKQPRLKSLQLELRFLMEKPQANSLYFQLIHELMGLPNLETLALYVIGPLSLSESDVREMGASWPNIRNLQFHSNSRQLLGLPPGGITIHTDLSLLPSFLRYLPSLEQLHIQFTCYPPLTAPQERLPAPAFRILNLDASPSPEASREDVVAYLAAVLPRSACVRYAGVSRLLRTSCWRSIIKDLDSQREEAEPSDAEPSDAKPLDAEALT